MFRTTFADAWAWEQPQDPVVPPFPTDEAELVAFIGWWRLHLCCAVVLPDGKIRQLWYWHG